jgi:hypothetical protein
MRFRRTTSIIFLSLMTAFFLSACGGGGDSGGGGANTPTVITSAANPISTDNATLNGTVNPNGDNTVAWFEYGPDSALATSTKSPDQTKGSGTSAVPVTFTRTGLSPGTTFYYRLAASNSAGTARGSIVSVTTPAPNTPPTVQTNAADNLSITGATLHGGVIPNGLATIARFQWGTDNTFAVPNVTSDQSVGSDNASYLFAANLSGLTPGTKYYYRVVATNSAGTSTGLTASFTTNTLSPTVVTTAATQIGTDNATLNGTVNPNGLLTTAHFDWGTDNTFATFSSTPTQAKGSALTAQPVNATLAAGTLSAGTKYYFRIVANNSAGDSTGSVLNFTTLQNPPPNAIAHYNESVYSNGPGTGIASPGATVVTLDGSESNDPYGTITSYGWTQIAGTNEVTPDDNTAEITTFTVPPLDYGVADNVVFQLTVTDNRGLSGTDTIWKELKWGYFDDFHVDSTAAYEVFDILNTGGTFTYDAGGQRAQVVAGDNTGIKFQKTFTTASKLINNTGVFSFDFTPTAQAGTGGSIAVRLNDGGAYLELSTADGKVRKVFPATPTDEADFAFPYVQGTTYHITITFSPIETIFEATGGGLTVGPVSLITNTSSIGPVYFEIDSVQQTSYFDNIKLEAAP